MSSAPKRNAHALVVDRVVDLILAAAAHGEGAPTAHLSLVDEAALRDVDVEQIGPDAVGIASRGTAEEWRAFLTRHFRERYDLPWSSTLRPRRYPSLAAPRRSETARRAWSE